MRADEHIRLGAKPGARNDFALTVPVFLAYQLGVVFLHVRNATDLVTARLLALAGGNPLTYLELTAGVGVATMVALALLGRGQTLRLSKLVQTALEAGVYAIAMGTATSWVVGRLFAGPHAPAVDGPFAGVVMSFGAGFYEELAFRVLLFGLGAKVLLWLFARHPLALLTSGPLPGPGGIVLVSLWGVASAAIFSGMHYLGPLGDPFDLRSFVARGVLGLALTLVYATRGFATAVWTHALYDVWILVF